MSTSSGFFQPLLRSRSISYGALMDFTDDDNFQRTYSQKSHRNKPSLTSYDDMDEQNAGLTESSPLLNAVNHKKSANSHSASRNSGFSHWITRITPPFLLPSDSSLEASMVRDGENGLDNKSQETDVSLSKDKEPPFSRRDKLIIAMISAASFCTTVVFSCIAPFFPAEAAKKGASQTIIGLVFGIFELVMVVTAPIFGRFITVIGSKFMYGTGLCVTGGTAILFGLLNLVPAGTPFIVLAFVIRIVEATGDAAVVTSSFAIVAKAFTYRVATIIGLIETFSGLGFAAGPPIGGLLYEAGGYQLPFMVLGGLLIVSGICSFLVLPKQNDFPTTAHGGMFNLLRMQAVWTMVFALVVAAISIAFLDPTLQPHLSGFNLSSVLVGLMFFIMGGMYTLTAPFWGYLIDRKDCARWVMLLGCGSTFISLLFIGPSPLFPFEKQLWLVAVSEVFMGIGLGALFIPPFQQCLIAARQAGYPDTFETYGLISGLFQSSVSFGAFLGATLGGFMAEWIGFAWAATALALLHVICAVLIVCLMLCERRSKHSLLEDSRSTFGSTTSLSSPYSSDQRQKLRPLYTESRIEF